jgi:2-hydroxyacylsphingosine 1-beta-galactosyltransferase
MHMNFWQRVENTLLYAANMAVLNFIMFPQADAFRAKYAPGVCTSSESMNKTSIFIIQTSFVVDPPRPLVPAMKVVGPILPEPGQPLPPVRITVCTQCGGAHAALRQLLCV